MRPSPPESHGAALAGRSSGSLLGDLARALSALGPRDPAARVAIARALGLEAGSAWAGVPAAGDSARADALTTDDTRWLQAAALAETEGQAQVDAARERRPGLLRPGRRTAEPVESTLTPMTPAAVAVERPAWLDEATPLRDTSEDATRPPLEPLLVPRWTPGILSAAVSRDAGDGPIDVLRLIDAVARGELIRALPARPRPTLASGAQVLVDVGDTLLPFREDCALLVDRVRRIVGEDRVDVLRFDGSPTRGAGPGGRRTWRPYEPPTRPRVVLAITLLGAGPAALDDAAGWLALAQRLRAAACRLVALVPTEAARVAPALRRAITVLEWDRHSTLATAARALDRSPG